MPRDCMPPTPLKISTLDLEPRAQAALDYFFRHAGAAAFEPVAEAACEAVVFDHDRPESRRRWSELAGRLPGIVLSVLPQEIPGTVWVRKPVNPAALLAAAERLRDGDWTPEPVVEVVPEPAAEPVAEAKLGDLFQAWLKDGPLPQAGEGEEAPCPLPQAGEGGDPRSGEGEGGSRSASERPLSRGNGTGSDPHPDPLPQAGEGVEMCPLPQAGESVEEGPLPQAGQGAFAPLPELEACGTHPDVEPDAVATSPHLFHRGDSGLLPVLRDMLIVGNKVRMPVHVDCDDGGMTFLPDDNRLALGFPPERLRALCEQPLPRRLKVRVPTDRDPAPAALPFVLERFDAVLWRLAALTARGRLPAGTDPERTLHLRSWPNFTRLAPLPNALRIAALWSARGASLVETAELLDIPQRHVFTFFNAAAALDLVSVDGSVWWHAVRRDGRGERPRLLHWLRRQGRRLQGRPERDHRVVVVGPVGAGKTTAIAGLCGFEPSAGSSLLPDFGATRLPGGDKVQLFSLGAQDRMQMQGERGQEQLDRLWEILSEGGAGLLLLLDNSRPTPLLDLKFYVNAFRRAIDDIGLVVGVTRLDVAAAPTIADYATKLDGLGVSAPVFEVDARRPDDIATLVAALLLSRRGGIGRLAS